MMMKQKWKTLKSNYVNFKKYLLVNNKITYEVVDFIEVVIVALLHFTGSLLALLAVTALIFLVGWIVFVKFPLILPALVLASLSYITYLALKFLAKYVEDDDE